jgi:hypothetical protein
VKRKPATVQVVGAALRQGLSEVWRDRLWAFHIASSKAGIAEVETYLITPHRTSLQLWPPADVVLMPVRATTLGNEAFVTAANFFEDNSSLLWVIMTTESRGVGAKRFVQAKVDMSW